MSRTTYRALTLGEILVIAVGCGLGALCIVTMAFNLARKQKIVDDEVKEMQDARADLEIALNKSQNATTLHCLQSNSMADSSITFDIECDHLSKSQRVVLPPPQSLVRISGLRDSWPLVSAIEMPGLSLDLHPADSAISVSQTTSLPKLSSGSGLSKFYGSKDATEPLKSQREPIKRSSTSGSKISNVLRSASQHVNSAQKNSVRVLKAIGFTGPPPHKVSPSLPTGGRAGQLHRLIAPRYICATQPSGNMRELNISSRQGWGASRVSGPVTVTRGQDFPRPISKSDSLRSRERRDGDIQALKPISNGSTGDSCKPKKRGLSGVKNNSSRLDNNRRVTILNIDSEHAVRNALLKKTYRTMSASDPTFLSARNSRSDIVLQGATIPPWLLNKTFPPRLQNPQRLPLTANLSSYSSTNDLISSNPLRNKTPAGMRTASANGGNPGLPRELSRDISRSIVAQKMTMNSADLRKIRKRPENASNSSSNIQRPHNTSLEPTLSEVPVAQNLEESFAESIKSPTLTIGSLIELLHDFVSVSAVAPRQSLLFSDSATHLDQDSPTVGLFESSVTLSISNHPAHGRNSDNLQCVERKKQSSSRRQKEHKRCQSDGPIFNHTSSDFHSSATLSPRPNHGGSATQQCVSPTSVAPGFTASSNPPARILKLNEGDKLPAQVDSLEPIPPRIIWKRKSTKLDIHEFRRQYQQRLECNRVEQKRLAVEFVVVENQSLQHGSEAVAGTPQTMNANPLGISGIRFPFLSTVEDMAMAHPAIVTERKAAEKLFNKDYLKNSSTAANTPLINSFDWQDFRKNLNDSNVCHNSRLEYHSPLPLSRKQLNSLLMNTDSLATDEDSYGLKSTTGCYTTYNYSLGSANLQDGLEQERPKRCFV